MKLRFLAALAALCWIGGCASGPDYNYVREGSLSDIYRPAASPPALPTSCARLEADRTTRLASTNPTQQWAAREVQVQVLSFDEIYASRRIHAALLQTLDFDTTIPARAEHGEQRIFVRIPQGFVTDFSSIPPGLAQSIHRSFGKTAIPAIAHDFLYAVGDPTDPHDGRLLADTALRRGMVDNASSFLSRHSVYRSVRLFGARSYGGEDELRFLDRHRGAQRIVVPIQERAGGHGAAALRQRYVRVCDLPVAPASVP